MPALMVIGTVTTDPPPPIPPAPPPHDVDPPSQLPTT
jgi:hypothetical protein